MAGVAFNGEFKYKSNVTSSGILNIKHEINDKTSKDTG